MRLRILLTFLSLAFVVTACNNSKKHDNMDQYDLEHQAEAMQRNQQNVLLKDLKECKLAPDPESNRMKFSCPSLKNHPYTNRYDNKIPNCRGFGIPWTDNKCTATSLLDKRPYNVVMKESPSLVLDVVMALEVIPIEITNHDACFMNTENVGFLEGLFGKGQDFKCQGLLLKNVAGMARDHSGTYKKHFGNVIVAPLSPNGTPADKFAERVKLAFGHISPSKAIRLQQVRYGNRSFNIQNHREGYAHVIDLTIKDVRYRMDHLNLVNLNTGDMITFDGYPPYFSFGVMKIKYGYDYRSYESTNIGHLTPNYLTESDFVNYILNQNQEQQELSERDL